MMVNKTFLLHYKILIIYFSICALFEFSFHSDHFLIKKLKEYILILLLIY